MQGTVMSVVAILAATQKLQMHSLLCSMDALPKFPPTVGGNPG